jgi:hypothetical protein
MSVRVIGAMVLLKAPAAKTSTRSGWDRDSSLGFPRCLIIRGRKYRLRHELESFKTRSIAATASGGRGPPRLTQIGDWRRSRSVWEAS